MTETYLDGHSLDIVAGNIAKLRSIFPEIVVEDKIDFVRLQAMLGRYIDTQEESYKFDWFGKNDAFRKSQTPSTGTLRPCEVESRDWDTTQNLYIEGDNLEVLKLLQKSYSGQVKMIYIDPPYNKDKDFVYTDKWSDPIREYKRITGQLDEDGNATDSEEETEGGRHTRWLNMMYPRLRLAKNLLTDDGGIFISIDDTEVANLKRLCNDVFGEENFAAQIAVVNNLKGRNDRKNVATCHEFILIYGMSNFEANGLPLTPEQLSAYDQTDDSGNKYQFRDLRKRGQGDRREDRPNMYFPIYYNETTGQYSLDAHADWIEIYPVRGDGSAGRWRWGKERVMENLNILHAKKVRNKDKWGMEYMVFLNPMLNGISASEDDADEDAQRDSKSKSFWNSPGLSTDVARQEMKKLLDSAVFEFPKSVELIAKTLYMGSNPHDIILDFFSGSATTAHAVMQLNAEDGGNRRFVMVQLPEEIKDTNNPYATIAEIGKERIRRAGEKIKTELEEANAQLKIGEEPKPIPDIGFKVFKLDSSNLERWNLEVEQDFYSYSKEEQRTILAERLGSFVSNFVPDRTELDMVYEVMLKYGLDLTYPVEAHVLCGKNVYEIGMGALFITFANQVNEDLAQAIVEKVKELQPDVVRVVAKDLGFVQDQDKTNFKETLKSGVEAYFAQTDSKTAQFEFITI